VVTITLHIDDATLERARAAASARNQTLEEIMAAVVHDLGKTGTGFQHVRKADATGAQSDTGLLGLFADEPALADAIDEESARRRAERWAHAGGG
jgi:hypothetical protein